MSILLEKPSEIAKNHFLLRIKAKPENQPPLPGQFINIKTARELFPLIRRPISVFNYENEIIEIVIQEIGLGTNLICQAQPGPFNILGPLGRGFSIGEKQQVLLVGGGVGNAALYYLARRLKEKNNSVTYIYGSRSGEFVFLEDRYKETADEFFLMTDDGSRGKKGLTTDMAAELFASKSFDTVYTCGPNPMMSIISSITPPKTTIETSVENYFACGVGLCAGCTVQTSAGLKRACYDGPVMDGRLIKWETMS